MHDPFDAARYVATATGAGATSNVRAEKAEAQVAELEAKVEAAEREAATLREALAPFVRGQWPAITDADLARARAAAGAGRSTEGEG